MTSMSPEFTGDGNARVLLPGTELAAHALWTRFTCEVFAGTVVVGAVVVDVATVVVTVGTVFAGGSVMLKLVPSALSAEGWARVTIVILPWLIIVSAIETEVRPGSPLMGCRPAPMLA
jgi:hypothetical protein